MRLLVLALLAAASPALAQSDADTAPAEAASAAADPAPVDSALVGEWRLESVVEGGEMEDYGVDLQAMTCVFSAEGRARVSMMAVQDGETMSRQRVFRFDAAGGTLTKESGVEIEYRLLGDRRLEIQDGDMVVHLVRADA